MEDFDDDSYIDMPSTDGAAGPSTPILPALSPVDSGDDNTERQPFLSRRPGKQSSGTANQARMPKPKKGSFMKSIQDNKYLVKNLVSRKDSDRAKKPGFFQHLPPRRGIFPRKICNFLMILWYSIEDKLEKRSVLMVLFVGLKKIVPF